MEDKKLLYNVYAWHKNGPAIMVGEGVGIREAMAIHEAYLNRGLDWDAYLVEQSDDLGYINKINEE